MDRPGRLAEPLSDSGASRLSVRLAAEVAALAVLVAAHVWLLTRLLHTKTFFDEGVYLVSLDELRHGAALGREVFTSQVPGFYLILEAIGAVFGGSVVDVRLGIVVIDAIGLVFAFLLGRRLAGTAGGLLTAALIAIAPTLPELGGRIYADSPATVLVLISLWLAVTRRSAAAGAVFAASVLVKLSVVTAAPTLIVLLLLEPAWRRRLVEATAGAAALLAVLSLLFIRDLRGIWDGAFAYHLDARKLQGLDGWHLYSNFFDSSGHTVFLWFTVAAGLASTLVWRGVWALWLWPLLTTVFVLRYQPLRDNHLIMVPYAFALPVGVTLGLAVQRAPAGLRSTRSLAIASAVTVAALGIGWLQQLHRVELFVEPEDPALVAAASRLESVTAPDDLVIADQPIVAFLAKRRVPPELVDTANSRFDSGSLTVGEVLETIDRDDRVTAVIAGRAFYGRPSLMAGFRDRFLHRLALDSAVIFYGRRP